MLTPEQIEERRKGIGASEVAAIFNRHPFISQADLYMDKRGLRPPKEQTEDMRRGSFLETGIAYWTAEKLGIYIAESRPLTHPVHPIALATPDRFIHETGEAGSVIGGMSGVLEIKSPRNGSAYTPPEVDPQGVPDYVMLQVQWQLGVARARYPSPTYDCPLDKGIVSALVNGELWIYHFTFNPKLFDFMLKGTLEWWDRHIINDVPPPMDGSEGSSDYLKQVYPTHKRDELIEPDEPTSGLIFRLADLESKAAEMKHYIEDTKNKIKDAIGDGAGFRGPWGTLTWKKNRDGIQWDDKAIREQIKKYESDWEKYTTPKPGPRVFRPSWKGDLK
jgi:putative phage-type endonuclease